MGDTDRAERTLAALDEQDRGRGEILIAVAVLRLAQGDPRAAAAALAPVLDGSAPLARGRWLVNAFLLEAIARNALADLAAAERALERALDAAEPDTILFPFLIYRAPGLLEHHARDCAKHAPLVSEILSLLPAQEERGQPRPGAMASPHARGYTGGPLPRLIEPLSRSETRVLRYLPTNLSVPEIARELCLSVTTVRTHIRHLFVKLGVHRRTEAVARARALSLLAPSPRSPGERRFMSDGASR
jgi:LuxR family maltose regulon positive regulatory protein